MSACQYEMKFPIRPAPPPPINQKPTKKPPSTWNDPLRDTRNKSAAPVQKKKPPPRPPPPKFSNSSKKSAPSRPGQLIADLFHRRNHVNKPLDAPAPKVLDPPDPNPPMLIDFSSPPSSPTLTTRSSSDALSVNSFGSDGVTQCSGGSSGNGSNVESGFEDDFDLFGGAPRRADAQPRDPWSPPPRPPEQKSPWVAFPSPAPSKKAPPPVATMPTIIRSKPEGHRPAQKACDAESTLDLLSGIFQRAGVRSSNSAGARAAFEEEEDDGWASESPPMPTCPPPAPPPEVLTNLLQQVENTLGAQPHGIALYDYAGEQPEDLSFRKGDVINLVRRIDENWFGGEMGGREGSVPANFISVRVPLSGEETGGGHVTALYAFQAETWEDLGFEEGAVIKVTHRIDQDWLYGECDGRVGQFPASFVDHVPADLPLRRTG